MNRKTSEATLSSALRFITLAFTALTINMFFQDTPSAPINATLPHDKRAEKLRSIITSNSTLTQGTLDCIHSEKFCISDR